MSLLKLFNSKKGKCSLNRVSSFNYNSNSKSKDTSSINPKLFSVCSNKKSVIKSREFTANDKLVGELATKIDKRIPGHVKGVNVNIKMKNGKPKEVDIVTRKEIIEVKSGDKPKIGRQLRMVKEVSRKEPIGYAPKISKTEKDNLQNEGFNVFWNDESLVDYIEQKKNKEIKRGVVSHREPYSYRRKK